VHEVAHLQRHIFGVNETGQLLQQLATASGGVQEAVRLRSDG
jgi:hypothetical protein